MLCLPAAPPLLTFLLPLWSVFPLLTAHLSNNGPQGSVSDAMPSNCCPHAGNCSSFNSRSDSSLGSISVSLNGTSQGKTNTLKLSLLAPLASVIPHLSDHAASCPHRNLVLPHLHKNLPSVTKCCQFSLKYLWTPSPLPHPLPWTRLLLFNPVLLLETSTRISQLLPGGPLNKRSDLVPLCCSCREAKAVRSEAWLHLRIA